MFAISYDFASHKLKSRRLLEDVAPQAALGQFSSAIAEVLPAW
jgi:hypothetical protein